MITAILVQNWWRVGLAIIVGIVVVICIRNAIHRARDQRAQTQELRAEWETYQRRHGQ